MSPPAPHRVPYLRLVPSVEIEPRAAAPELARSNPWRWLSMRIAALRAQRARDLAVDRLTDHERRDIGLERREPSRDPRHLVLRV